MTMNVVRNPFDELSRFPFDYPSVFNLNMPVHRYSPYSRGCAYRCRPIQSYHAPVTRRLQVAASFPREVPMGHLRNGAYTADLLDMLLGHAVEEVHIQREQNQPMKMKTRQEECKQEKQEKQTPYRNSSVHREGTVLASVKPPSDLTLSADGSAYEMRMQIAPHATVSNVTMQVLRNVQDADRKLQVVVDTETHEEVALFGSWPMVSESKHSASRTVSLAADARTDGVTVTLEEGKSEKQERELLIKIPREMVTSPTAIANDAETVNEQSTSSDVQARDPVDTANSNADTALMPPAFPQVEHEQPEDDAASQNSSEVTVEDVDDNEADNN